MKQKRLHTVLPTLALAALSLTSCFKDDSGVAMTRSFEDMIAIPELTMDTRYVDMGLSVKWAVCNLGADSPEKSGGYYQWAGTRDVSQKAIRLYLDNCPYHTGPDYETGWSKYIPSGHSSYWSGSGSPDGKTVLDSSDDAAHSLLGEYWHIPTKEEWDELINNCTCVWTTRDGVQGYAVTSRKPGFTDCCIFLPAVGLRSGNQISTSWESEPYGYYWSSSLDLNCPYNGQVMVLFPWEIHNSYYDRGCGNSIRPVCTRPNTAAVTGVKLDYDTVNIEVGGSVQLTPNVYPSDAADKTVTWSSSDEGVASVSGSGLVLGVSDGTATITVTTIDGGFTATCSVTVIAPEEEVVDLGLSVKWRSRNLGATKQVEYGGYYQWAGTRNVISTGSNLDNSNCPYHSGSSNNSGWTKYVTYGYSSYWSGTGAPDGKTVLESSDDAASVLLGGGWRTPTKAEWNELLSNCTWTYTTRDGVNGYKVTSKKSGYTNKFIFLPLAGYRSVMTLSYLGVYGEYWSASLDEQKPHCAYVVSLHSKDVNVESINRYYGHSVRPVHD